ncbi:MAG: DeoR/GlpR transcriptional regulator [Rhizobiaceae bacterium]|nr:DeoR/GlpR transcriptional regulator [Rhizobiaceae bacterium]
MQTKKTFRQSQIVEVVSKDGSIEIATLAERLQVSGETIRRDVKELQRKGLLNKIHGGAALPSAFFDTPFHERLRENGEGKLRIGQAIAEIVKDGDSMIIETGTTATFVAQALSVRRRLTVVTNSVDVARSLAFQSDNAVFMAGGRLTADDGAALDESAIAYISQFRVKYAIFSVAGIDLRDGLMSQRVSEANFSRAVISRAENVILAADRMKFGRSGLVTIADPRSIDILVTDCEPSGNYRAMFEGVRIEIAG